MMKKAVWLMVAICSLLGFALAAVPAHQGGRTSPAYISCNTVDAFTIQTTAKRANWINFNLYADQPVKRKAGDDTVYHVDPGNIRLIARLCRDGGTAKAPDGRTVVFVAGAPAVLDWESWYDQYDGDPLKAIKLPRAQAVPILAEYMRVFHAEAGPTVKVGLYAMLWPSYNFQDWPVIAAGKSPAQTAALDQWDRDYKALNDQCDFTCPCTYLIGAPWVDRDLAALAAQCELSRQHFIGKPVHPFIWSRWNWAPYDLLPVSVGERQYNYSRQISNGPILWGEFSDNKAVYGPLISQN